MAKARPTSFFQRLPRAGQVSRFLGGSTLFIAPLPLPTGVSPNDFSANILEVNDVYMDIGMVGGNKSDHAEVIVSSILALNLMMFGMVILDYYLTTNGPSPEKAWDGAMQMLEFILYLSKYTLFPMCLVLAYQLWYSTYYKSQHCPLRFNRQRQQLCYIHKKGAKPIYVPWEKIAAWLTSSTLVTNHFAMGQHDFGMGFYDPDTKLDYTLSFGTLHPMIALGQWEAIRAFMEGGPNATLSKAHHLPASQLLDEKRRLLHECYQRGLHSIFYVALWYLWHASALWRLPYWIAEWDEHYPHCPFPKEVEEWSKPLPKSQWTPPSDELRYQAARIRYAMRQGVSYADYINGKWQPETEPDLSGQLNPPSPTIPPTLPRRPRKGKDGKYLKFGS